MKEHHDKPHADTGDKPHGARGPRGTRESRCPMTKLKGRATTFAAGLLFGIFGRELIPRLVRKTRPYAKEAIKMGLVVSERARTAGAEIKEAWGDLYAEAVSEIHEEHGKAVEEEPAPE